MSADETSTADWVDEFAELLAELSAAQDELLALLAEKRDVLARMDADQLQRLVPREAELVERLHKFQQRRSDLLARSEERGPAAKSLRELAHRLPAAHRRPAANKLEHASHRLRELRQSSLTNWVLAQRTLLHLSQLLEIIATGGRLQPTYGKEHEVGGALLNQVG